MFLPPHPMILIIVGDRDDTRKRE